MVPKPAGNEAASIWLQKEPFMRVILLAFGLLMLSACATTKKYEALLNTWAGKSENALLQSWGPPDSFYENDGVKYLAIRRIRRLSAVLRVLFTRKGARQRSQYRGGLFEAGGIRATRAAQITGGLKMQCPGWKRLPLKLLPLICRRFGISLPTV